MNLAYTMFNTLAQAEVTGTGNEAEAAVALVGVLVMFGIVVGVLVVCLAILAIICWYLSSCLKRIPPQFRTQTPGKVWLLMIIIFPFPLIWNFFVCPRIAESYQAYFTSIGRTDVGDCGLKLAKWYCWLVVACMIPCVNIIASFAVLVVWVMLLIKFASLKGQIPAINTPTT